MHLGKMVYMAKKCRRMHLDIRKKTPIQWQGLTSPSASTASVRRLFRSKSSVCSVVFCLRDATSKALRNFASSDGLWKGGRGMNKFMKIWENNIFILEMYATIYTFNKSKKSSKIFHVWNISNWTKLQNKEFNLWLRGFFPMFVTTDKFWGINIFIIVRCRGSTVFRATVWAREREWTQAARRPIVLPLSKKTCRNQTPKSEKIPSVGSLSAEVWKRPVDSRWGWGAAPSGWWCPSRAEKDPSSPKSPATHRHRFRGKTTTKIMLCPLNWPPTPPIIESHLRNYKTRGPPPGGGCDTYI